MKPKVQTVNSLQDVEEEVLRSEGLMDGYFFPECARELRPVLTSCFTALREEDKLLRRSFARCLPNDSRYSKGLANWLFETTLVYVMWKRLMLRYHAEWERPYPGERKAADLVIPIGRGHARLAAIEAKWWTSSKCAPSVATDFKRLQGWKDLTYRISMSFWFSPRGDWTHDACEVRQGLEKHGQKERPLFAAIFDTHVARQAKPWSFAMIALSADR